MTGVIHTEFDSFSSLPPLLSLRGPRYGFSLLAIRFEQTWMPRYVKQENAQLSTSNQYDQLEIKNGENTHTGG